MNITYLGYKVGYTHMLYLAMVNYLSETFDDLYQIREKELAGFLNIEKEHFVGHVEE